MSANQDPKPDTKLKLCVVPHYAVTLENDTLLVRTRSKTASLRGATVSEVLPLLLPLLDGSRRESEIIGALDGKCDARKARAVLRALMERGLIEGVSDGPGEGAGAGELESVTRYLSTPGTDRKEGIAPIRAARVVVVCPADLDVPITRMLTRSGVGEVITVHSGDERCPTRAEGWSQLFAGAALAVVVGRKPIALDGSLESLNEAALASKTTWLSVTLLGGAAVQIGPTFVPNITGCHACLVEHFRRQTEMLEPYAPFAALLRDAPDAPSGDDCGAEELAIGLLATEVLRALGGRNDAVSFDRMVTIDLEAFRTREQVAPRVPRCGACGPTKSSPRMRVWS